MKKLLIAMLLCVFAFSTQAQNNSNQVTQKDYERMLRNEYKMEFREFAIKTLELSKEQILGFDPLYMSYMSEKNELAKEKYELLKEYSEEMAEDDSAEDKEDDRGDFLENYWEVEIKEMELKKDYFDRMEDKITADKAFGFFMLEDIAEHGIQKKMIEKRYVPIIIEVPDQSAAPGNSKGGNMPDANPNMNKPIDSKYKTDIDAFSKWVQKNSSGKVSLDHHYTHDGLKSMVTAITALARATNVSESKMNDDRNRIVQIAEQITKDPTSDKHADLVREAFIKAADMLKTVQEKSNITSSHYAVNQLEEAAKKVDAQKLLTPQAEHVYAYFQKAQMAIDNMANSVRWATKN